MMPLNIKCNLFQDSSQIELLKELMDLQKDMVVMMLSLLEGESFFSFKHHNGTSKRLVMVNAGFIRVLEILENS